MAIAENKKYIHRKTVNQRNKLNENRFYLQTNFLQITDAYSEPCQTPKMESLTKNFPQNTPS